jgi:hypothetical protein
MNEEYVLFCMSSKLIKEGANVSDFVDNVYNACFHQCSTMSQNFTVIFRKCRKRY